MESTSTVITYDDFSKLELRVATVLECKPHANADKLLVLQIELGNGEKRQICAGLRQHYQPEQLVGKQIVVVANLPYNVATPLIMHALDDPAVTVQLLELNAVVGVIGKVVGANKQLTSVGITCALCHSTVDDSVIPGVGSRLDGWPNKELNVGAIVALSPALDEATKAVFRTWGPGRYDPHHHAFDGTNIIPLNSPSLPVVIPPIYGLKGVDFETFTADGPISYWNNYVGVTQMGGQGSFKDPRIGLKITQSPDQVTPKLTALLEYQLSLQTPPPPEGSFDSALAAIGEDIFNDEAQCASCHIPSSKYTDVLTGSDPPKVHDPLLIGTETVYASRSATGGYRTTPLRALWQHPPYFHDGSAPDLLAVPVCPNGGSYTLAAGTNNAPFNVVCSVGTHGTFQYAVDAQ